MDRPNAAAKPDRPPVPAAAEGRHRATAHPWWVEQWGFVWSDPVSASRGFVELTALPNRRRAWFVCGVLWEDRPYVLCRDDGLTLGPSTWPLEVRGEGLWSHAICEMPLEHWTVAMEAFAVALDDPAEAWAGERGERVGLAFDLEWESAVDAAWWMADHESERAGYALDAEVHGELQLGDHRWVVDGVGSRIHLWGPLVGSAPDVALGPDADAVLPWDVAPYVLPGPSGPRRLAWPLPPVPGR